MTETAALVCGHVFKSEREVKLVVRHADGGWQLVCGEHDHPHDCSDFKMVGLNHLLDRDPELRGVADLNPGWMAERTPASWALMAHDG